MVDEKMIPPWKRELLREMHLEEEQDPAFLDGVIDGYHAVGGHVARKSPRTPEYIYKWAQGFAHAYAVRLELEERKKRTQDDGTTKNTARVDVR